MQNTTRVGALIGSIMAVAGSIDSEKLLSAAGVVLSVLSLVATWGLGEYHEYRAAKRTEDATDRKAAADADAERLKVIADMEARLAAQAERVEKALAALEARQR